MFSLFKPIKLSGKPADCFKDWQKEDPEAARADGDCDPDSDISADY
jgi:hypothetical protein